MMLKVKVRYDFSGEMVFDHSKLSRKVIQYLNFILKGLSHEMDFKNFDQNLKNLV
jgi:hypothetical protein